MRRVPESERGRDMGGEERERDRARETARMTEREREMGVKKSNVEL